MTIQEAITRFDNLHHNTYSTAEKIAWLSQLDSRIFQETMSTRQNCPIADFKGYDDKTPADTELLVPHPHEDVYFLYLDMKVDYYNGEIIHYNNSVALFELTYMNYRVQYNHDHLPIGQHWKFT